MWATQCTDPQLDYHNQDGDSMVFVNMHNTMKTLRDGHGVVHSRICVWSMNGSMKFGLETVRHSPKCK